MEAYTLADFRARKPIPDDLMQEVETQLGLEWADGTYGWIYPPNCADVENRIEEVLIDRDYQSNIATVERAMRNAE